MYTFLEPWRHYKMLDQSGIHPKTYMHTMCLSTFRHDGCCYKNHMQHARFRESITLSFSNKRTMLYLEGNDAWKGVLGVEHCSEKQGEGDWVYIHSAKDCCIDSFYPTWLYKHKSDCAALVRLNALMHLCLWHIAAWLSILCYKHLGKKNRFTVTRYCSSFYFTRCDW